MKQLLPLGLLPLLALMTGCGAADESTPDTTDPDPVAPAGEDEPLVEAATQLDPGIENPLGYPDCGEDSSNQPSPCIDPQGAVRCAVDTGYAGDELALCPLDAEDGMVLHFGPEDYDDPAAIDPFLIMPGEDLEFCMYLETPNTSDQYIKSYHGRMRPNSHHLIVTQPSAREPSEGPFECGPQIADRWLFGSQDPQIDVQQVGGSEPGDPDYGLAQIVAAQRTLLFDLHNVNVASEPQLREAWASFQYVDASEVEQTLDMLAFYQLNIAIPPLAASTTPLKTCEAPTDRYVGLVTGHAHQWMTRFSVWHDTAEGSNLIYETFDWAEPGNATYRDSIDNPPLPVAGGAVWGAQDGYLFVKAGESLSFECEYMNTEDRTVHLGDTAGDEMCNVFGYYFPTDGDTWNCF